MAASKAETMVDKRVECLVEKKAELTVDYSDASMAAKKAYKKVDERAAKREWKRVVE